MKKVLLIFIFLLNGFGCSHKVYRVGGENPNKDSAWFVERKIDHGWFFDTVSDDEKILYCKSNDSEDKKKPAPKCFRADVY